MNNVREKLIEIGDEVTVVYNDNREVFATVLYIPQAPNEMWVFQNKLWEDEIIYQNPVSPSLDCIILRRRK